MKWRRQPPDAAGYWLRLNAGHRVQMHYVSEVPEIRPGLSIGWGWGGEGKLVPITEPRLQGWWWYGPMPPPPDDVAYIEPKKKKKKKKRTRPNPASPLAARQRVE